MDEYGWGVGLRENYIGTESSLLPQFPLTIFLSRLEFNFTKTLKVTCIFIWEPQRGETNASTPEDLWCDKVILYPDQSSVIVLMSWFCNCFQDVYTCAFLEIYTSHTSFQSSNVSKQFIVFFFINHIIKVLQFYVYSSHTVHIFGFVKHTGRIVCFPTGFLLMKCLRGHVE